MKQFDLVTIYIFIALFSLALGSFLNVVIYRLPRMLRTDWLKEYEELTRHIDNQTTTTPPPENLFFPRSHCPHCHALIKAHHNIPLLSYFLLGGQCAHCHQKIDWQYPLVELITCLLFLLAFASFGFTWICVCSWIFIGMILPAMIIDLKHQLLPDSLTLGLLWVGLLVNTESLFTTLPIAVISAAGGYLFLWAFIQIFYLVTKKMGMGHGDFKLFAALGAWFGWTALPFILFFSSVIGVIYGLVYLKVTKQSKETPIPFGPFLGVSGLVYLFYHHEFFYLLNQLY